MACLKSQSFSLGGGQGLLVDHALVLLDRRHVRVAVEGKAVRGELLRRVERVGEPLGRLVGKAVDEVDVHTVELVLARPPHGLFHLFERLNAVDGLLYDLIHVLHPDADAVEADVRGGRGPFLRKRAGIGLNTDLGVLRKSEPVTQVGAEIPNLFRRQVGGGPAAPVHLYDGTVGVRAAGHEVDFSFESRQVALDRLGVLGHLHVAATVVAERPAERQVQVEGQWGVRGRRCQVVAEGLRPIVVVEVGRCRVAGVPRARLIVSPDLVEVDVQIGRHRIPCG